MEQKIMASRPASSGSREPEALGIWTVFFGFIAVLVFVLGKYPHLLAP